MYFGVWILDGKGVSEFRFRSTALRVRRSVEQFGAAEAEILRALVRYAASGKRKGWRTKRIISSFVDNCRTYRRAEDPQRALGHDSASRCLAITSGYLTIQLPPEKEADHA